MNTASIFVKIEPGIKKEAQRTAEQLGFSLSSLINAFLRQLIKTKTVNFSAQDLDEIPNMRTRAILKRAEKDLKTGNTSPMFDNAKDAIDWLHKQL